ncbi:MAG: GNAT family N-acetyltransferase, partial [Desertifilum sp.]|nr:GNAT family N-acetyltransferase [Desertifilum sp.]
MSEAAAQSPDCLLEALEQLILSFQSQQICSAFFRLHPFLNQNLSQVYPASICQETGETIGIDLTQSPEEIWRQTRSDHRKDINRHKRSGWVARMVPFANYMSEFIEIYRETMERVSAAQSYYFSYDYFSSLLALEEQLHLCIVEIDNRVASACLVTECCGIVNSFLGGTRNSFLKLAPEKLLFDYVRFWAKERGNEFFNMGGGLGVLSKMEFIILRRAS